MPRSPCMWHGLFRRGAFWNLQPPFRAFIHSPTASPHPTGKIYSDPPQSTSFPTSSHAQIWPQTIRFLAELVRLRLRQGTDDFKTRVVRRTTGTSRMQAALSKLWSESACTRYAHVFGVPSTSSRLRDSRMKGFAAGRPRHKQNRPFLFVELGYRVQRCGY